MSRRNPLCFRRIIMIELKRRGLSRPGLIIEYERKTHKRFPCTLDHLHRYLQGRSDLSGDRLAPILDHLNICVCRRVPVPDGKPKLDEVGPNKPPRPDPVRPLHDTCWKNVDISVPASPMCPGPATGGIA